MSVSRHLLGRFLRKAERRTLYEKDGLIPACVDALCRLYTLSKPVDAEAFLSRHVELVRAVVHGEGPDPYRPARPKPPPESADSFLGSFAWRKVRMEALTKYGARCQCCGKSARHHGAVMNVDHIKPRRTHPELALAIDNLQVLCQACNHGKGNWDTTDWRLHP